MAGREKNTSPSPNFKRLEIPALPSSGESHGAFVGKTVDRSNRRLFLVDALCEFGWHNFDSVLKVINQTV